MTPAMLTGLMPALVTPFDEQGEPDLNAAEAVVERHLGAGVSGIVALGSTGEFPHLDGMERRRFTEELVEIVAGRAPLVVGVGASGTREAADLARHAESVGADAVISVTPFYWKVSEEALFQHFRTVSESVGVPNLIYNFPALTGIDLSPALISRIAAECPNVAGLKDTTTEYMHTVRVLREVKPVRPEFAVLAGMEDQILPALLAGADGAICGLANVAPELFVELVARAHGGELETAAELHRRVLRMTALADLGDPVPGAIKAAMQILGVPVSPTVRGPGLPISEESLPEIEDALRGAGLLEAGASR